MQKRIFHILFFATSLLLTFSLFPQAYAADTKFTVVIDAGHGGHDPGAVGRRGKEKNINLSVALKLGRLIKQNCPDTRVVYTREKDVFIPLHRKEQKLRMTPKPTSLFLSIPILWLQEAAGSAVRKPIPLVFTEQKRIWK